MTERISSGHSRKVWLTNKIMKSKHLFKDSRSQAQFEIYKIFVLPRGKISTLKMLQEMAGHSWLILIRHGKEVNEKEEIISDTCEYVFHKRKFDILLLELKNESWSSGQAARKGGHPEIYDYIQKLLGADLQIFMTLIDGPRPKLLDYRDLIKKLCEQESHDNLKLYIRVLTFGNEINPFLERIVTGGEKYVKIKELQSSDGSSQIIKFVPVCVWWDMSGIIFYEVLEPGQTVTAEIYCNQLERVQQELIRRGCVSINNRSRILHHNNAPAYTAKGTREKIRELGFECLPHPPYSKNILPSHYHLFKSLSETIRQRLTSAEQVKTHVDKFLKDRPKNFFEEGIKQLPLRWKEVLDI